jgi:hypothetical protein
MAHVMWNAYDKFLVHFDKLLVYILQCLVDVT